MENKNILIGFIGQGFIGKNYADDFESRGYNIVRYDNQSFQDNREKIGQCDVVFIAVPTPTTLQGFNYDIVKAVLPLIGKNNIAVIKSTIKVGTARKLQEMFPDITLIHSPEFLTEKNAAYDAAHPDRNIIGILDEADPKLREKAELVMSILPEAPYQLITRVENAEMIKYANNVFLVFKVIFANILFDLSQKYGLDYEIIKNSVAADKRIGPSHLNIMDKSGRGAGGNCFIKDFETLIEMLHENNLVSQENFCAQMRNLNLDYLKNSQKDLDLIAGVYGN